MTKEHKKYAEPRAMKGDTVIEVNTGLSFTVERVSSASYWLQDKDGLTQEVDSREFRRQFKRKI